MTPMQLKRTIEMSVGGLWGSEPAEGDDGIAVVRVADFDYPNLTVSTAPTTRVIEGHLARPRTLREGDLLIEKSGGGDRQNVGRVVRWVGDDDAIFSNFINLLRPAPGFNPRWLAYLHRHLYLTGAQASCTRQTTGIQNLDLGAYLAIQIEVPTVGEQQHVADFLDHECERISSLSNESAHLQRGALAASREHLREAVLDQDWPLVPLKYYARTGTGHTPSREHAEYWRSDECGIPWFTLADVNQIRDGRRTVVRETVEKVSEVGLARSSAVKHPAGTVLLSRTASVGFSAVMGVEMAVSQDFMTWTCGPELDPRYLLAALRAMQPELRALMYGSTHKTIYMPDLHALRIPLPPLDEQHRIGAKMDEQAAWLWPLHDQLGATREVSAEYRDALIAEAVTGALDAIRLSDQLLRESAHAALEGQQPEVLSR